MFRFNDPADIISTSLDPEKLFPEIREHVQAGIEAGVYDLLDMGELKDKGSSQAALDDLSKRIEVLKMRSSIGTEFSVESSKPILGPVLKLFKRAIRKVLRPVMKGVWSSQSSFNVEIAQSLDSLHATISEYVRIKETEIVNPLELFTETSDIEDYIEEYVSDIGFSEPVCILDCSSTMPAETLIGKGIKCIGVESRPAIASDYQKKNIPVIICSSSEFLEFRAENIFKNGIGTVLILFHAENGSSFSLLYLLDKLCSHLPKGVEVAFIYHNPLNEAVRKNPPFSLTRFVHPLTLRSLMDKRSFMQTNPVEDSDDSMCDKEPDTKACKHSRFYLHKYKSIGRFRSEDSRNTINESTRF